jgi:uncharacterized RDD family membrane protein YckC
MTLTCPHCAFSKEIDPGRIPDGVKKVVCPRCKEPFALPERESQAVDQPTEEPQPQVPAMAPPVVANAADLPKAGFWIRVVASMVDSLLAGLAQFFFAFVLMITAGNLMGGGNLNDSASYSLLTTLFSIVFGFTYSVFFTGYCGQTPGKMVLRIKVIRTSGAEIGYGRALLREVPGKFLSGILLGIGYLMVAFDDRKQGLHDRIADTYVIKL